MEDEMLSEIMHADMVAGYDAKRRGLYRSLVPECRERMRGKVLDANLDTTARFLASMEADAAVQRDYRANRIPAWDRGADVLGGVK